MLVLSSNQYKFGKFKTFLFIGFRSDLMDSYSKNRKINETKSRPFFPPNPSDHLFCELLLVSLAIHP